jgi:DNA repair protein RadC
MSLQHSTQGHRERLRQRFIKTGFEGFADYEVVELLLTLCIPRKDVKPTAKALIGRFGSLKSILDAPRQDLETMPGLGTVAPVALKIVKSITELYLQQQAEDHIVLNSTDKIERFWRSRLGGFKHEVFEIAHLDSAYRLIKNGVQRLEEGIADRAQVYPRKVIEAALKRSASGLILAHNHPSGKAYPSEQDEKLTKVLQSIAAPLSIQIVDHLIITDQDVFSFRRAGLLN